MEQAAPGNLVTHEAHGHPESSLYPHLDETYGDQVDYEYVSQCGCGGRVTRVAVW